ncbi:hypothetical protein ANRL4_00495 [Anaerolineae bacterium]|nr:hypothetical protein ANRL4_00495 [Anaerolineae bacterium]
MESSEMRALQPERKANKVLRRLVLVAVGIGMAWLLAEILLRVAFEALPPKVQGDIQQVRRVPWSDETIVPVMPFTIDRDFQVRMPVGLKDYPVRWSDARFAFETISAWENHRAGLRSEPPVYPLDIITFGDSFTFCWVKWEACYVKLISAEGWHTFNAAIPGTGTTGQLALISELVPAMKPRLVIWQWYNNDLSDNYDLAHIRGEVGELETAPADDPVLPPQGLAQYSAVIQLLSVTLNPPRRSTPYQHFWEVRYQGRPLLVHSNEYPYATTFVYPRTQYGWERGLAAQEEGHRLIRDQLGAKLMLIILPTKEEAYAKVLEPVIGKPYLDQMAESREKLLATCVEMGWYCLDPLPAFREAITKGETIYYAFDSHLDESGNQILAVLVKDFIKQHQLLE